ncbi:YolD-like protein [gut metagenome]|uniref:YolD-like protein n=1 Tax=gut metagenome TaxID=749906 RepID=J9GU29_9ZZZZ
MTGYDAAVKETARLTEQKIDLDEYEKATLDQRILLLQEHLQDLPEITITYFEPDERKEGGKYISATGKVKKIDTYEKQIVLTDKQKISIENILSIQGELFRILETED